MGDISKKIKTSVIQGKLKIKSLLFSNLYRIVRLALLLKADDVLNQRDNLARFSVFHPKRQIQRFSKVYLNSILYWLPLYVYKSSPWDKLALYKFYKSLRYLSLWRNRPLKLKRVHNRLESIFRKKKKKRIYNEFPYRVNKFIKLKRKPGFISTSKRLNLIKDKSITPVEYQWFSKYRIFKRRAKASRFKKGARFRRLNKLVIFKKRRSSGRKKLYSVGKYDNLRYIRFFVKKRSSIKKNFISPKKKGIRRAKFKVKKSIRCINTSAKKLGKSFESLNYFFKNKFNRLNKSVLKLGPLERRLVFNDLAYLDIMGIPNTVDPLPKNTNLNILNPWASKLKNFKRSVFMLRFFKTPDIEDFQSAGDLSDFLQTDSGKLWSTSDMSMITKRVLVRHIYNRYKRFLSKLESIKETIEEPEIDNELLKLCRPTLTKSATNFKWNNIVTDDKAVLARMSNNFRTILSDIDLNLGKELKLMLNVISVSTLADVTNSNPFHDITSFRQNQKLQSKLQSKVLTQFISRLFYKKSYNLIKERVFNDGRSWIYNLGNSRPLAEDSTDLNSNFRGGLSSLVSDEIKKRGTLRHLRDFEEPTDLANIRSVLNSGNDIPPIIKSMDVIDQYSSRFINISPIYHIAEESSVLKDKPLKNNTKPLELFNFLNPTLDTKKKAYASILSERYSLLSKLNSAPTLKPNNLTVNSVNYVPIMRSVKFDKLLEKKKIKKSLKLIKPSFNLPLRRNVIDIIERKLDNNRFEILKSFLKSNLSPNLTKLHTIDAYRNKMKQPNNSKTKKRKPNYLTNPQVNKKISLNSTLRFNIRKLVSSITLRKNKTKPKKKKFHRSKHASNMIQKTRKWLKRLKHKSLRYSSISYNTLGRSRNVNKSPTLKYRMLGNYKTINYLIPQRWLKLDHRFIRTRVSKFKRLYFNKKKIWIDFKKDKKRFKFKINNRYKKVFIDNFVYGAVKLTSRNLRFKKGLINFLVKSRVRFVSNSGINNITDFNKTSSNFHYNKPDYKKAKLLRTVKLFNQLDFKQINRNKLSKLDIKRKVKVYVEDDSMVLLKSISDLVDHKLHYLFFHNINGVNIKFDKKFSITPIKRFGTKSILSKFLDVLKEDTLVYKKRGRYNNNLILRDNIEILNKVLFLPETLLPYDDRKPLYDKLVDQSRSYDYGEKNPTLNIYELTKNTLSLIKRPSFKKKWAKLSRVLTTSSLRKTLSNLGTHPKFKKKLYMLSRISGTPTITKLLKKQHTLKLETTKKLLKAKKLNKVNKKRGKGRGNKNFLRKRYLPTKNTINLRTLNRTFGKSKTVINVLNIREKNLENFMINPKLRYKRFISLSTKALKKVRAIRYLGFKKLRRLMSPSHKILHTKRTARFLLFRRSVLASKLKSLKFQDNVKVFNLFRSTRNVKKPKWFKFDPIQVINAEDQSSAPSNRYFDRFNSSLEASKSPNKIKLLLERFRSASLLNPSIISSHPDANEMTDLITRLYKLSEDLKKIKLKKNYVYNSTGDNKNNRGVRFRNNLDKVTDLLKVSNTQGLTNFIRLVKAEDLNARSYGLRKRKRKLLLGLSQNIETQLAISSKKRYVKTALLTKNKFTKKRQDSNLTLRHSNTNSISFKRWIRTKRLVKAWKSLIKRNTNEFVKNPQIRHKKWKNILRGNKTLNLSPSNLRKGLVHSNLKLLNSHFHRNSTKWSYLKNYSTLSKSSSSLYIPKANLFNYKLYISKLKSIFMVNNLFNKTEVNLTNQLPYNYLMYLNLYKPPIVIKSLDYLMDLNGLSLSIPKKYNNFKLFIPSASSYPNLSKLHKIKSNKIYYQNNSYSLLKKPKPEKYFSYKIYLLKKFKLLSQFNTISLYTPIKYSNIYADAIVVGKHFLSKLTTRNGIIPKVNRSYFNFNDFSLRASYMLITKWLKPSITKLIASNLKIIKPSLVKLTNTKATPINKLPLLINNKRSKNITNGLRSIDVQKNKVKPKLRKLPIGGFSYMWDTASELMSSSKFLVINLDLIREIVKENNIVRRVARSSIRSLIFEFRIITPTFFIEEVIYLMVTSIRFKDSTLFMNWLVTYMNKIEIKKHKKFISFLRKFVRHNTKRGYLDKLGCLGFFFDIRGKVGVTGSKKKRHYMIRYGAYSATSKSLRWSLEKGIVWTNTGSLGTTLIITY